jgi:PBP1b-binding outer membrane lipoprotein LpoB
MMADLPSLWLLLHNNIQIKGKQMQIIKLWIPILSASLLMTGCVTQQPQPVVKVKKPAKKKVKAKKRHVPAKPKKNIKLKKVEDNNFSSEYMYPGEKKKKEKSVEVAKVDPAETAISANDMSKSECISMIGAEKFDKYTQMLGDEASAIKRCKMLKAM